MGFIAQLSEYNDFLKDTTMNSYDACLKAVEKCDYFVLLIGSRKGGMYQDENKSITRKEYETAYQLAKEGKIKKIVILVRQSVWDVKEDRKSLARILKQNDLLEKIDVDRIVNYDSKILNDAEHIISFINEVTRNDEARNKDKPVMNWVHTFSDFEDVVQVMKSELNITSNLNVKMAEENIKSVLAYNLQNITYRGENGGVCAFYIGFAEIRDKLLHIRKSKERLDLNELVSLSMHEVAKMSDFILFFRNGISDMDTSVLENIIANGIFLSYSTEQKTYVKNPFCMAMNQIVREIKKCKQYEIEFPNDKRANLIQSISGYHHYPDKQWEFSFYDLALLNSIYERLFNIQNLTSYMIQYINTHDDTLVYPAILNGLVDSERPSEEEILKVFEQ